MTQHYFFRKRFDPLDLSGSSITMNARLSALLKAFTRATGPAPANLDSALRDLPEPGATLSPWLIWSLIALVRHRDRQLWVANVVRNKLHGAPSDLARMGALGGHPEDVPQSGPVPGMPECEYYFHGRGCCLTHKVNGEEIDVDFWNDSAEYFDIFFYEMNKLRDRVMKVRQVIPPEPPKLRP
jgi:hypothetical protein